MTRAFARSLRDELLPPKDKPPAWVSSDTALVAGFVLLLVCILGAS